MGSCLSLKTKYYKYFPFKFLVEKIIQNRTKRIVDSFDEFIEEEEKILDIGAGGGWIGKEIQKRKDAKVTLLDVIDFNQTDLELFLYDGTKMPFLKNSFETALLIFVLHHTKNPLEVLREAKRLSRDRIIVLEDTYASFFDKIFLFFWDILTNLPSFFVKPFGEKMPFHFKKISEWEKIFQELQLKIVFLKEFPKNKLIRQVLFVLKK